MKKFLVLLGVLIVAAVLVAACGGKPTEAPPTEEPTPTEEVVVKPAPEVPYLAAWEGSAHNAVDTEAFRHWDGDDPAEVPVACAKCHTTKGYQDFLGADGSTANKVDVPVPASEAQGIQCVACHNPVATFQMTSVAFPGFETDENGEPVPYVIEGLGDSARCMVCHQGRESKASVDAQIARFKVEDPDAVVAPIKDEQGNDVRFGFRNIHYYAAAATLFGTEVKGGYEYDGKLYDGRFRHVEGIDSCIGCHDPHSLEVKVDTCANCHEGVTTVEDLKNVRMVSSASDYDGDGDVTEGIYYEIEGLKEILLAEIQRYAKEVAGTGIVYNSSAYPYWFADADGDGVADKNAEGNDVAYNTWTARLLKAAYNYQVASKDPGQFAHGGKYIIQLLYDSIEDLGGDVSKLARSDAGHFAGNTEPFRHWDEEGEVPGACAKCHTATGLPQFLKEGANISNEISNGFMCTTCHNEEAWPERYSVASVTFPSGKVVSFGGQDAEGNYVADDGNLCLLCHQGRSSKPTVDRALAGKDLDKVDATIRFSNIHYFAAGATLFGADVQGAYMYEGKEYAGYFEAHPLNKCQDCHDVHALKPKVEACAGCHGTDEVEKIRMPSTPDYDGDGDTTEGVKAELDALAEALYAEIQKYAEGTGNPITYNPAAYPYFFGADGKGYAAWTPRLLKAAYNYQYYQKDPGAFVHNSKFVAQILIDSIADLGGDVSAFNRP
ncbi:MAG TPA: hypothetical protein VNK49_09575 [Anaerolineales bacterium]|nr:hypothetical protein [Anaerolineales bacterium]